MGSVPTASSKAGTRYTWAFLAWGLGSLVCLGLRFLLPGEYVLFIFLLPAVAFAGLYCGLGPSILVIAFSLIEIWYGTIAAFQSLPNNSSHWIALLLFSCACGAIVTMGEVRRRSYGMVRKAQTELEEQVKKRTKDLDAANRSLRQLSACLLQLQDEERRRFARELHDGVGQTLVALSLNLAAVHTDVERLIQTSSRLADSEALIQEMTKDVRTISHLLHPPLLDEAGLSSAVRWLVDGFAQRSKIEVELDLPDDFGRLTRELETSIFRVVQECLSNIHRHSESSHASVRFTRNNNHVCVEVKDTGKGIPAEKQIELASTSGTAGVGIRGIRERLLQLGGKLEINSDNRGTVVVAWLPITTVSSAAA